MAGPGADDAPAVDKELQRLELEVTAGIDVLPVDEGLHVDAQRLVGGVEGATHGGRQRPVPRPGAGPRRGQRHDPARLTRAGREDGRRIRMPHREGKGG